MRQKQAVKLQSKNRVQAVKCSNNDEENNQLLHATYPLNMCHQLKTFLIG